MAVNAFDAVLTSAPLNSTAAKVVARGEHWVPETPLPPGMQHWKSPPPMKPFVASATGQSNLTGTKFGKFTVIGLLAVEGGKHRGARWVCRCVCGDYESRSAQAIVLKSNGLAGKEFFERLGIGYQCFYCAQWEVAKNRYRKRGSRPLAEFTQSRTRVIEAKTPETIIAEQLFRLGVRENVEASAAQIIAEVNRGGYRIKRDPNEERSMTAPPENTPAPLS